MMLVMRRSSSSSIDPIYVESLKDNGLFKTTYCLDEAKKFESIPQLLTFVARHKDPLNLYDIWEVKRQDWKEVRRL